MVRGSSQSQSSSGTASRPGVVGAAPRAAGIRRRRIGSGSSPDIGGSAGSGANMLRFYTDDTPGMKISPTMVLVMSLCFIGFVTALHVIGKFYRYRSEA